MFKGNEGNYYDDQCAAVQIIPIINANSIQLCVGVFLMEQMLNRLISLTTTRVKCNFSHYTIAIQSFMHSLADRIQRIF